MNADDGRTGNESIADSFVSRRGLTCKYGFRVRMANWGCALSIANMRLDLQKKGGRAAKVTAAS